MAINRSKIKIWIEDADTLASALASTDAITGEIRNYNKSGGEKETESDPVFGGYVDKEKPQSQVELSFEVVPKLGTDADRWDAMIYAVDVANSGVYTMASETSTQASDKAVFIQGYDGTNYKSWCFNNCNVTVFDLEHAADDNQTGNLSMKFSPTNDSGVSNFMTAKSDITVMPNWTALDNN